MACGYNCADFACEAEYGYERGVYACTEPPMVWGGQFVEFADSVGYKYPVHTPKNARAALTYFN